MRQRQQVALTVVLTTLLFAAASFLLAQSGPPSGPPSGPHGCSMMQSYNSSEEVVIEGIVEGIETPECPMQGKGVHLRVTSEGDPYEVHLGPAWFVTEQESFAVEPGDAIIVTGVVGPPQGTDPSESITLPLLAREVVANGRTLTLRDETGAPVWAGSGRGRRNRP